MGGAGDVRHEKAETSDGIQDRAGRPLTGADAVARTCDGRVVSWGCNDDGALGRSGDENVPMDVDVGAGAVVLPGVRIGPGATLGAGSVALNDIPGKATAVGIPAR